MKSDQYRRREIAQEIRLQRERVAEEVTTDVLAVRDDELCSQSERIRQCGRDETRRDLDYLAAAIETGDTTGFETYARWARDVMKSRGCSPAYFDVNLQSLANALRRHATPEAYEIINHFVCAGKKIGDEAIDRERSPKFSGLAEPYLEAALRGDKHAALEKLLKAIDDGVSIADIYVEVLQRAMYRIGALWQTNKITVAQEHLVTTITQYVVARLYSMLDCPTQTRGNVVITGIEGEQHQLGANMVADMLEANGWAVRFLGTNTPSSTVAAAIEEHDAAILGISVTLLVNLPALSSLMDSLRRQTSRMPKVMVGGSAFRQAPQFYREIGADACALDLHSAIESVNRIAA